MLYNTYVRNRGKEELHKHLKYTIIRTSKPETSILIIENNVCEN